MKITNRTRLFDALVAASFAAAFTARAALTIYPNPDPTQAAPSVRYVVEAKQEDGAWQTVPVYDLFGTQIPYKHDITTQPHIAYFDSSGEVQLRVAVREITISNCVVRPKSKGVAASWAKDQINLAMSDDKRQLCLEVNDEPKQPLLLFSNPLEKDVPDRNDPNVRFFGPGYTKLRSNGAKTVLRGQRNQTIYLAGGAIVEGAFMFDDCSNITLRGHGILASRNVPNAGPALFRNGTSNCSLEDLIIVCDNEGYGVCFSCTSGCGVRNTKVITRIRDGINTTSSLKRTISDSFIMAHDDAITASVSPEAYWNPLHKDMDGLTVERCVIAQMGGGNPFRIWGDSTRNSIKNLTVADCDVIYALCGYVPDDHWSQAVFEFSSYGGGAISNVFFDNIRIEKATKQNIFEVRPRRGPGPVDNVRFRNVACVDKPTLPSRIEGRANAPVRNITIENFRILGIPVTNAATGDITVGANTEGIKVGIR